MALKEIRNNLSGKSLITASLLTPLEIYYIRIYWLKFGQTLLKYPSSWVPFNGTKSAQHCDNYEKHLKKLLYQRKSEG